MPPKFDPSVVTVLVVRCTGGEAPAGAALAPRLGPLGVPAKKVGEDIAKITKHLKGLKVTVELTVQNRNADIKILPSASTLLLIELKEPPRDRKKVKGVVHNGNLSLDQVKKVAREMRHKSMANHFKGTVLEVLGTALSIGCTVEGENPHEIQRKIKEKEIIIEEYDV